VEPTIVRGTHARATPHRQPGLVVLATLLATLAPAHAQTRNVVLVVADGLRWQEVYTGADRALIDAGRAGGSWTKPAELRARWWRDDTAERRALLLPFLWGTVAKHGQLYGNRLLGSRVDVTNAARVSYPGYNELLTGRADPSIDRNDYGPNPNVTVLERLAALPGYRGRVAVYGTWWVLADVINAARSRLPVHVGADFIPRGTADPAAALLGSLYASSTHLYGANPFDAFVHVALREGLSRESPRVLFVGFGDTDLWAHMGRYDLVLETAHQFDAYVGELWRTLQSRPGYRNHTTLILTTDHGRGRGSIDWREHGVLQPGSEEIWLAVLGPDTAPLGERRNTAAVAQGQVAATLMALLGEDLSRLDPLAAPSVADVLAGHHH